MDIGAIAIQPDPLSLTVAYRPIYFKVYADSLVGPEQPMYADVYFTFYVWGTTYTYYKTFTSFSTSNVGGTNSVFEFDIQDAAQEVLKTDLLTVTVNNIEPKPGGLCGVAVYFRGSTYSGGVLIPNPTVPTQATATTPAISTYSGTQSNTFWILNATLSPDYINDALNGLNSPEPILQGLVPFVPAFGDQRIYGLTNLPVNPSNLIVAGLNPNLAPEIYASDHGALAVLILQFGTYGGLPLDNRLCSVYIEYFINGVSSPVFNTLLSSVGFGVGITYIPCGMKEIALHLPALIATLVDPSRNIQYRIVITDDDAGGLPIFASPMYKVRNTGVENKRLWFQNYWGHWEQISFARNSEKFTTASSEQFRPHNTAADDNHPQQKTGRQRFNVRVQDEETLIGVFPEPLIPWVKELLASPFVLLDEPNYAPYALYPVQLPAYKVLDDTFTTRKTVIDGRINYEVSVKIIPSLDYIIPRN